MTGLAERPLGRTGVMVPILGLGAMDTPGSPHAIETLAAAATGGVTFVDTAREYAGSEHLIGRYIREAGSNPFFVASKTFSRTADGAQREVDRSLSVLGVDRIDLYQLHDVSTAVAWAQVMADGGALDGLKVAQYRGLIGHVGLSTHDLDVAKLAIVSGEFDTIMVEYSAFYPQSRPVIELAAEHGVGVIVMRPVGGSGRTSVLRGRAAKGEAGLLTVANLLRYVWTQPGVAVAIPGARYPSRVAENVATATAWTPMGSDEAKELERLAAALY